MCKRVFSVGFGPGLDSLSPARSRRSASHAAGTLGNWRDDVCRVCVVLIWRRLSVRMILGRVMFCSHVGKGATSDLGKYLFRVANVDTRRLDGEIEMWKRWLPNERYVTKPGGNLDQLKINIP